MASTFDSESERRWFAASNQFMPTVRSFVNLALNQLGPDWTHSGVALQFHERAFYYLLKANEDGAHAIALSLLRQCVDPLFLIECGLVADETAKLAMKKWASGSVSMGQLRREYAEALWRSYDAKFLDIPWSEFLSDMYSQVQDYAHFNARTVQWTMSRAEAKATGDGMITVLAHQWKYDPEQATRITMFCAIVSLVMARAYLHGAKLKGWTVGGLEEPLREFEEGVRASRLVGKPFSWKNELLGLTFPVTRH